MLGLLRGSRQCGASTTAGTLRCRPKALFIFLFPSLEAQSRLTLLASALEKLDNSRRLQRNPRKLVRERCEIILLPYLEAAVERFERARTVAGKYELRWCTTKVKDMYHPFHMETRRLIASSCHTITFTNPEGKRRDLLAVVVAEERWGDAYNALLAYMGKLISRGFSSQTAGH
jgi:hypothetical protein